MQKRVKRRRSRGFGRIPKARDQSGLSRSFLYELAAEHEGLFLKAGKATIVDLDFLDDILEKLPPADVKARGAAA